MQRKRQRILGLGVLAATVVAWLYMSWFRWPDCLIDFGRELYIPWQMIQGKILYKDIYFYYGPLAQYFHAFLFKCFGPSLIVIIITNFVILSATVYVIYLLFKLLEGYWAGITAACLFLGIFAFGRATEVGNYNFICPYSHELVYGFSLSLAGLFVTAHWLKQSKTADLGLIGFLTGLIFLTKLEVFTAFAGSVMLAFILDALHRRLTAISFIKKFLVLSSASLIAPAIFLFYISHQMTFHEAVHAFAAPFVMTKYLGFDKANMVFYKTVSGFDDPLGNFLLVLKSAGGFVLAVFLLGGFSYLISRFKSRQTRFLFVVLFGLLAILVSFYINVGSISLVLRGVPFLLAVFMFIKCRQFLKEFSKDQDLSQLICWIALLAYAFLLTFKILLYVSPHGYGFVLAVPGTLITAVLLTNDAACFGRGKFYYPKVFRALAIAFLLGVVIVHFRLSRGFYEHINSPIAERQDRFLSVDSNVADVGYRSVLVNAILQWIDKETSPKDTLVVMPEGVMINYLSRRRDPLPISEFEPSIVNLFGEDKIIDLLRKTSPSYIILIDRDMLEHGAHTFGLDYGQRIYQWILGNYEKQFIWGEEPTPDNPVRVPRALLMRKIN